MASTKKTRTAKGMALFLANAAAVVVVAAARSGELAEAISHRWEKKKALPPLFLPDKCTSVSTPAHPHGTLIFITVINEDRCALRG